MLSETVAGARSAPCLRRPSRLRAAFKLTLVDAFIAQPIVVLALPVNTFLGLLFVRELRLGAVAIGIMTAIPAACQVVQLPLLARFAGRRSTKGMTLLGASFQLLAWLAFSAALPHLAAAPGQAPWLTALWLAAISLGGAVAGVGWFGWLHEWVPPPLLARFFSARNRLAQLAMLAFVTGLGVYLSARGYAVRGFQTVVWFACLLRVGSLWLLWRMDPASQPERIERPSPLRRQLSILRREPGFVRVVGLSVMWGFAASCFGQFYVVFELERLRMSAAAVCIAQAIEIFVGVLVLPSWGRIMDRYGYRNPMLLSLFSWQAGLLVWCAISPDNWRLLFGLAVWSGLTSGGFLVGLLPLMLRHVPAKAKSLGIATSQALTSCTIALAAVAGGCLIAWGSRRWPARLDGVYHICFLLQPMASLGVAWVLLRLPAGATVRTQTAGAGTELSAGEQQRTRRRPVDGAKAA